MLTLTLRSLRHRAAPLAASFLSALLGAWITMSFASLVDTGRAPGVSGGDRGVLTLMASVVGGWGLAIVLFAVLTTLTLAVRQRSRETALLKSVGATPAQITAMIVGEAGAVAVTAGALATWPATLTGNALLRMFISSHQVSPGTRFHFGTVALSVGFGVTLVACVVAALAAARRGTRVSAAEAMAEAAAGTARMGRGRIALGILFLGTGIGFGFVTMTVMHGKGVNAMQTAGQAAIASSIGLAILAPGLLRGITASTARPLRRIGGVCGDLAVQSLRGRRAQAAGVLMPVILFAGIGIATLYMQGIENAATAASGLAKTEDQKNIESLNLIVVGMIIVFAAILVVNTLIAATTHRRLEFGLQRLVGATPSQILRAVALENLVLAVSGVLLGALAALTAVLPYSYARTDRVLPESRPAIDLGICVVALVISFAAGVGTARREVRIPAVEALRS